MGGSNQKQMPAASAAAVASPGSKGTIKRGGSKGNPIRFHENAGEVHFHDDKANLKVAIPVPEFSDKYAKFRNDPKGKLHFIDTTNGAEIRFNRFSKKGLVDVEALMGPIKVGTSLKMLDDFADNK